MKTEIALNDDARLKQLADNIALLINDTKSKIASAVSREIVYSYWTIGKYIVEFEQNGNTKAEYGTSLLTRLSKLLTLKIGKGYSRPNLNNMRKCYLLYPNLSDVSDKLKVSHLSWSHICEIIKADDELERSFYMYLPNKEELRKPVNTILNN